MALYPLTKLILLPKNLRRGQFSTSKITIPPCNFTSNQSPLLPVCLSTTTTISPLWFPCKLLMSLQNITRVLRVGFNRLHTPLLVSLPQRLFVITRHVTHKPTPKLPGGAWQPLQAAHPSQAPLSATMPSALSMPSRLPTSKFIVRVFGGKLTFPKRPRWQSRAWANVYTRTYLLYTLRYSLTRLRFGFNFCTEFNVKNG